MEYAFSIIMFALGGVVLIYSGIVRLSKSTDLIFRSYTADIKDKEKYAVQFSKLMALIALSFILSGAVGLLCIEWLDAVVAISSFIAAMVFGIKKFMKGL